MLGRFWFAGLAMLLHPMLMVGVIAIPAVLAVPSVPQDLSEAAMKGTKLTAAQAETLEHQLAENPQSLSARAQLLGYYYLTGSNDPEKHAEHVLWFIRNMPESEVVGGPLAQILPRLNPDDYLEAEGGVASAHRGESRRRRPSATRCGFPPDARPGTVGQLAGTG